MSSLRVILVAILIFTSTSLAHASDNRSRYWIGTGTAWEDPNSWYEYSNETQGHRSSEGHACTPSDPCGTNPKPTGEYGLPTIHQRALLENKQGRINYTDAHPFTREPASKTVILNSAQSVLGLVVEGDGGWENGGGLMALDINGSLNVVGNVSDDSRYSDFNNSIDIGRFGRGVITVNSGASLKAAKAVTFGAGYWNMPSEGTLNILDGTVEVGTWETIGGMGKGHVYQTGGTHIIGGDMEIAKNSDVTMSGGVLQVGKNILVGAGLGLAKFLQSGNAQVTVGTDLFMRGGATDATGDIYKMSGTGSLLVTGTTYVGQDGVAAMEINEGNTHTTDNLVVGNVANVERAYIANGAYIVKGGTVNVANDVKVGRWGIGFLELQAGSTMTLGGRMILGENEKDPWNKVNGFGTVTTASGSRLSAHDLIVGNWGYGSFTGRGVVNVAGTTLVGVWSAESEMTVDGAAAEHTTQDLVVAEGAGSIGVYNVNGGTTTVTNDARIGREGIGTVNIYSGSSMTVGGELNLGTNGGADPRGSGTIVTGYDSTVSAGTVVVGDSGDGAFIQGGEVTADTLVVGRNLAGVGVHTINSAAALTVTGDEIVGDRGLGAIVHAGGTNTVGNDLIVGKDGNVEGNIYELNGGNLETGNSEIIGRAGIGLFEQNGGTNQANFDLVLGDWGTGVGTYEMNAGSLKTLQAITVGNQGSGAFTQAGGAVSSVGLIAGAEENGWGTYTVNGGATTIDTAIVAGAKGVGKVYQNAGLVESDSLSIARDAGSSGRYELNGGDLIVHNGTVVASSGNGSMAISSGRAQFEGNVVVAGATGSQGVLSFDINNGDADRGIDALYFIDESELKEEFINSGDPEISSRAEDLAAAVAAMKADPERVWKDRNSFADGLAQQMAGADPAEKARIAAKIAADTALLMKLSQASDISRDTADMASVRGKLSVNDIHAARLADTLKRSGIAGMNDDLASRAAAALQDVGNLSSRQAYLDSETLAQAMSDHLTMSYMADGLDEIAARGKADEAATAIVNNEKLWQDIAAHSSTGTRYDRAKVAEDTAAVTAARAAYASLTTEQMNDLFANSDDEKLSAMGASAAAAVNDVTKAMPAKDYGAPAFQQAVQENLQKRLYDEAKTQAWDNGNGIDLDLPENEQARNAALDEAKASAMAGAQTIANNAQVLGAAVASTPVRVNADTAVAKRGLAALATADERQMASLERDLVRGGMSTERARNLVLEVQNVAQENTANTFAPAEAAGGPAGGVGSALAEALKGRGVTDAEAQALTTNTDLLRRVGETTAMTVDAKTAVADWGRNAMATANQTDLANALTGRLGATQASSVAAAIDDIRQTGRAAAFASATDLADALQARGISEAVAQQVAGDTNVLADVASRAIDTQALANDVRGRITLSTLGQGAMAHAFQVSGSAVLADPTNAAVAAEAVVLARNGHSAESFQNGAELYSAVESALKARNPEMAESVVAQIASDVAHHNGVLKAVGSQGALAQSTTSGALAQGKAAAIGMTKPQLVSAITNAGFGAVAGPVTVEAMADAIVDLQAGAPAAAFMSGDVIDRLVDRGFSAEVAQATQAMLTNTSFLAQAAGARAFTPTVDSTMAAAARSGLMNMDETKIENALRKSRVAGLEDQEVARQVSEALARVRANRPAQVFEFGEDLADALRSEGLAAELADSIASNEQVLKSVAAEYERSYSSSEYSDQDVLINGSLVVGGGGTATVEHTAGHVWVERDVAVGTAVGGSGRYEMHSGSLDSETLSIGRNGTMQQAGGTVTADVVDNQGRYDLNSHAGLSFELLNNSGTFAINGGSRVITGDVVNRGVVKTTDATVEYTGAFVNLGEYNSDPSTNTFADLYIGETGYLVGGVGDSFEVAGDFENQSRSGFWNTDKAMLKFTGAGEHDYVLNDASASFLWGTLEIDEGGSLDIGGEFTGDLVFDTIILGGGLEQLEAIVSGNAITVHNLLDGTGHLFTLDELEGRQISGGGYLAYAPVVTPEPASMVLFGLGGAAMAFARRRKS